MASLWNAVSIADHLFPEEHGQTYPMTIGRTMGGAVKTADLGDGSTDHIDMTIRYRLTDAHWVLLRNFIQDTARWGSVAFTFTDSNGTAYTNMHYISGLESFRRNNLIWTGAIRIAKDMSA